MAGLLSCLLPFSDSSQTAASVIWLLLPAFSVEL